MSASISVILPFRNAAATLDEALAGLLAEADPAREILAIDDASTDSGAARVRTWAARDARVRLLHNRGSGLIAALNTGLAEARGALLARMDADDTTHPKRLSLQRNYLLKQAQVSLLGARVRAFATQGEVGEGLARYIEWQNGIISPREHALARFIESPLCHPTLMMRREVLETAGGYRDLDGPEDYELFLRAFKAGYQMAKLPEVLLEWRHGSGRATFNDGRYSLAGFRRVKAPYLADEVRAQERIVLWGAGPTGRRLARELSVHGVRLDRFIDIAPDKIGRRTQGVAICGADSLNAACDVVIAAVGARGARALIRADLERRGFVDGVNAWFAS